jgi:hypothetical protein
VDDDEVTGSFRKEMASVFPAGENRARRWPTIRKARRFWFDTGDCRADLTALLSFIHNMMQTSQGLERDMSLNYSGETWV